MLLTTPQVAERLGVSASVVDRLRKAGDLHAANAPKQGQHKCFWKYDSKVVDDYRRARA